LENVAKREYQSKLEDFLKNYKNGDTFMIIDLEGSVLSGNDKSIRNVSYLRDLKNEIFKDLLKQHAGNLELVIAELLGL
jgi:hypothetical protein